MKIFTYILLILTIVISNSLAEVKCDQLPGFKKLGKDSIEYTKCMAKKTKELGKKGLKKLNTDSKLTEWIKKKLDK